MPHSRLVGIEPGQQAGARRRTAWGAVELGEADAARGQRVEIGCRNLATVGSDVRPAHVVHEDEDDVGARIGLCGSRWCSEDAACYRDGRGGRDEDSQQQQRSSAIDRHRTPRNEVGVDAAGVARTYGYQCVSEPSGRRASGAWENAAVHAAGTIPSRPRC